MMELLASLFDTVVPVLLIVAALFFVLRYFNGSKSPMIRLLERQIELIERQNSLIERHANAAERIASALETRKETA
ncbi:MAG: hypothetical protein LBI31_07465 [Zoogloeaceae bacterium]|jgi:hypothetical protein|nr:hypothetical protein [Zoogloeaceae bacterium]